MTELETVIARLKEAPGYVYLGSPYTKYAMGHEVAAYVVGCAARKLMIEGVRIFCPIVHGHFISGIGDMPTDWDFWKRQCDPLIDSANSLIVLMMDGWQESVGLDYEMARFTMARKPIDYIDATEFTHWTKVAR